MKLKLKPFGWYRRRKKSQETGCYRFSDPSYIKLAMTWDAIEVFCNDLELKKAFDGTDSTTEHLIHHLQGKVYLGMIPNKERALRNQICVYEEDLKSSFSNLFWEEYLYEYNEYVSYKDLKESAKYCNKVKRILDRNPELHGLTGQKLQDIHNHKLEGVDMDFSWRAWGALMAAYMNTKEKERKYDYMSFYM